MEYSLPRWEQTLRKVALVIARLALGYLFFQDQFINEELVGRGLCYTMTVPPNVRYRDRLRMALRDAQQHRRGLWDPNAEPVTPPACHRHPSGSRLCQQERTE